MSALGKPKMVADVMALSGVFIRHFYIGLPKAI